MKLIKNVTILVAGICLLAGQSASSQTIYTNGKIITVDSVNTIAEAVAVKDGRITAVGTAAQIGRLKGYKVINLNGKTLVPGFIDGHSHFMGLSRSATVNVGSPPMGAVRNITDLLSAIKTFQQEKKISAGKWIDAYGYDQDQLEERRHPSKEDLDAAFPNNPVTVTNINGHMSVSNSLALRISGIDANTRNPQGGAIERKEGSQEPTGLLQETAMGLLKRPIPPVQTLDEQIAALKEQQLFYASHGITTAQDGYSSYESLILLQKAAQKKALFIDIEALAGYHILDKVLANPSLKFGVLDNHFKIAGTKLVADGSPQGKTAYFSKPYLVEVPGCTHDLCVGFPNITQHQFNAAIIKAYKHDIRPFVHCNGDATIDMYIKAIDSANLALNTRSLERRPVTIHSQFVREDQLEDYKRLGIVAAMFSNHVYFWGDVHTRNLGAERASFISPLKSAMRKGIIATNHTDYPVTPVNQIFLLWTSVVRQSRDGKNIGPDERITPLEGLRAITINGAYEYKEENIKGSIEVGKLADFVVLSDDITTIDPMKIKDVTVVETIKEGVSIYKAH